MAAEWTYKRELTFLLDILISTLLQPQNRCHPKRTASSLYGGLERWSTRPTPASRQANACMVIWLPLDTSSFPFRLLMSIDIHSLCQGHIFPQVALRRHCCYLNLIHVVRQIVDPIIRSSAVSLIPIMTHRLPLKTSLCYIDRFFGHPTGAKIGFSLRNIEEANHF